MENSEKIENQLNLALDVPENIRERSISLTTGYEPSSNTWEVIIRYSGNEEELQNALGGVQITFLSNGYAVVVIEQSRINELTALSMVEYIEKPKQMYFEVQNGRRVSCVNTVQEAGTSVPPVREEVVNSSIRNLTGRGVLLGIIDSGIDYSHPDFRNEDGTTRIRLLWDQTLGIEFQQEVINQALAASTEQERYQICPSRDISGHGTHIAGIAGGNGRASNGRYRGVAFDSKYIIVKLSGQQENAFPKTTQLMEAVEYCVTKARELNQPIAINISFGNNYGSHSGDSLIESYMNTMADMWKTSFVIGTGNDGASKLHAAGELGGNRRDNANAARNIASTQIEQVEFTIGTFEAGTNIQLWKKYEDEIRVYIRTPGGQRLGPLEEQTGAYRYQWEGTIIYIYYGSPVPYSILQEIYFDFIPENAYLDSGLWAIELEPVRIVTGEYRMWFPAGGVLNEGTGFLNPTEETTLTIPSTATKVVSVGAYDGTTDEYAPFSGRGYTWVTSEVKPDIVAPGVDIISCAPGGGYTSKTGTSMATPFVTGSAALLMQWGIVNGNDSYLYGEKLKAYLIRGARQLPAFTIWPNPQAGWGALCVRNSIPLPDDRGI